MSLSLLDSLKTYEFGNAPPSPMIPAEDGSQFMSMSFPRRITRLPVCDFTLSDIGGERCNFGLYQRETSRSQSAELQLWQYPSG